MRSHDDWGFRLLGALALGVCISGCHLVMGDFERASVSSSQCQAGDNYRCSGAMLQSCVEGQWRDYSDCSEAKFCDEVNGHCTKCVRGISRCLQSEFQTCDADGLNWSRETQCSTAAYCDVAVNGCRKCLAGTVTCDGAYLRTCDLASDRLVTEKTCPADRPCNPKAKDCAPCVPGEYQCNGAQLLRCEIQGTETSLNPVGEPCASAELCALSVARAEASPSTFDGRCLSPLCEAGEYRCNPDNLSELQLCPQSRSDWETIEDCPSDAHCRNHVGGQCGVACTEGQYACNGATLTRCVKDGSKFEFVAECESAALCSIEQKACSPCLVGEYKCDGSRLLKCGTGQSWSSVDTCVDLAHCSAHIGDHCKVPECSEIGATRCVGDNQNKLEICSSGYTWQEVKTCFSATQCVPGKSTCLEPECQPPAVGCFGSVYRSCSENGTWKTEQTCVEGELCTTVGASHCTTGCPSAYVCRGEAQNAYWSCSVDATTNTAAYTSTGIVCATSAQCVEGSSSDCITPSCPKGAYRCSGAQIEHCNAMQTGWESTNDPLCQAEETCTVVNFGSSAFCAVCAAPGEQRCGATSAPGSLRTCSLDRLSWSAELPCSEGLGCVENGTHDHCAVACEPGKPACTADGVGYHVCLADGSGFEASVHSECASPTSLNGCSGGLLTGDPVDCPMAQPLCVSGRCVECDDSAQPSCVSTATGSAPRHCVNNRWVVGADCADLKPYCEAGACVACTATAGCAEPTPDCVSGRCEACGGLAGCSALETCDGTSGRCVPL